MNTGRPPLGAELVGSLEGSPQAKLRLEIIIRTLAGEITIPQACQELAIGESRFHELRNELLQHAVAALEPRARGRPPTARGNPCVAQLQQQVQALKIDLQAAQIREELALMLPHVLHPDAKASGDKKKRR